MRILIVEDEVDLARALGCALEDDGFAVDVVHDGVEGGFLAAGGSYDVILLDLMLPGRDGWQVLDHLRRTKATPVLILTARDGIEDRVRGLDLGADDYLVKPFALEELRARIRALIRRAAGKASPRLRAGDVGIDTARRTACKAGRRVTLSPKEYASRSTS